MLRRVALVRTDVSEELSASFMRVTRIGELGITPAGVVPSSPVLVTSQKTPFFIVTSVKTTNLTYLIFIESIGY
jgi:acetylglutamate synthase